MKKRTVENRGDKPLEVEVHPGWYTVMFRDKGGTLRAAHPHKFTGEKIIVDPGFSVTLIPLKEEHKP